MEPQNAQNEKNQSNLGSYPDTMQQAFVAFIDLLGQRDRLRKVQDFFKNGKEREDAVGHLVQAIGPIIQVREKFTEILNLSLKNHETFINHQSTENAKIASRMLEAIANVYSLSDAIILIVPIVPEDDFASTVNGIYSSLIGLAGISALGLAEKPHIPLRGGVDIGWIVKLGPQEIYGPGLVKAYDLESNFAGYPRIIFGDTLISFLKFIAEKKTETKIQKYIQAIAIKSMQLITTDYDKLPMLDFLGQEIKDLGVFSSESIYEPGLAFAKTEFFKFRSSKNLKLAIRYGRLIAYYESRHKVWNNE